MMIQAITGSFFGVGLYFILADFFGIPYIKTSKAIKNLHHKQRLKISGLDIWLEGIATALSGHIRINEFKKAELERDLKSAQINITPEMYKANAIVKASLVGILAVPTLFVFPLLSPVIVIFGTYLYNREIRRAGRSIKDKRIKIESELPRLVFTIEKTLKHSRDVLYMLESHAGVCGPELKHELNITAADMRSGNYESAITRFEARIGSSLLSDVCRGLIGILRGDDTAVYWQMLSVRFSEFQRQQLKRQASKVPHRVKKLSMCLLICFMLIYVVVIMSEIMSSIGVLFK